MNYNSLIKSPVTFTEATHTYTLGERTLTGVTSILKAVIFHSKYEGIPQYVLDIASARGTEVHARCAELDLFESTEASEYDRPEVHGYLRVKAENNIKMIANEYLVSDEMTVATMIDCIDTEGNLYDIKTSAEFDHEYVSWQLSLCAYLFERQNPHLKAGRLYGIWLRGENIAQLIEVERKSNEEVEALIADYQHGIVRTEVEEVEAEETSDIKMILSLERELEYFKAITDKIERDKQAYLDKVKAEMESQGLKKIETERIKVTLVGESVSRTFDSTRFKKEYPDLAEQFQKETTRKAYVKLSLKTA